MLLYIIIFILAFGLTFIVRHIAIRKAVLDIPNERSSHTIPTPRGGGLAIAIAWYAGLIFTFFTGMIDETLFYTLMLGVLIVVVSLVDDLIGVNYIIRLTIQAITAASALYLMGGLQKIDIGFYVIQQNEILTILSFFGIIWFINLYNFIDGIDGYAAGEAIFISAAVYVLFSDSVILLIGFAALGFLFWNWDKAKIFMGDIGSTLLGYTFAVMAIWHQNHDTSSLVVWLMLTSLFWFDATITIYRRFINKERLSQAHRKLAYQRIVQAGFSHQKTVLLAMIINLIILLLVYFSVVNKNYVLLFFFLNIIVLYIFVKLVDKKKKFE